MTTPSRLTPCSAHQCVLGPDGECKIDPFWNVPSDDLTTEQLRESGRVQITEMLDVVDTISADAVAQEDFEIHGLAQAAGAELDEILETLEAVTDDR